MTIALFLTWLEKNVLTTQPRLAKLSNLELLRRLPCLAWLSDVQIQNIHEAMLVITVKPKGLISREEAEPSTDTNILLLGTAQLNYFSERGSRALAILPRGVVFKFPSAPGELYRNFEVVALTECRAAKLPTELFVRLALGYSANEHARVHGDWEARLGGVLARYTSFVGLSVMQRVVLTLLELVRDFGIHDARGMLLRISPTHQQLAELAGASRSRVTKALLALEADKVISRDGRRLILDITKARKMVGLHTPLGGHVSRMKEAS